VDWIALRGRDKYYRLAKRLGVPSRAYFKLAQLNNKYGFLVRGSKVVDLGSSPGGWLVTSWNVWVRWVGLLPLT